MASNPKTNDEKRVGATESKWQMNMHLERHDMMSIIDRWRKCLNVTKTEKVSEAWMRDGSRLAALTKMALSQLVVDLVFT
jgi:hypothetical protein